MGLFTGQRTVGTVALFAAQVPPGPGNLLILGSGSGTVFIGVGTNTPLTSSNGVAVPSGGLSIPLFQGGGASQLYCIANGSPSVVSFIISTAAGLAQPGLQ